LSAENVKLNARLGSRLIINAHPGGESPPLTVKVDHESTDRVGSYPSLELLTGDAEGISLNGPSGLGRSPADRHLRQVEFIEPHGLRHRFPSPEEGQ